jgi:hypothetical protein
MHLRKFGLAVLVASAICSGTNAEDWRQFRGPGSNGVIQDLKLPEVWGEDSNIKWKVTVPGEGWSAPWSNNGLVYCPDDNGNTFVLKPGPKIDLVRVNKLPEEDARYWATSAASDGTLYIRSTNTVYAVSTTGY